MISYCPLFEKGTDYNVLGETRFAEETQVWWILEKCKEQRNDAAVRKKSWNLCAAPWLGSGSVPALFQFCMGAGQGDLCGAVGLQGILLG